MTANYKHIRVREMDDKLRIDFMDLSVLDELNIYEIAQELSKAVESATNTRVELSFALVARMSSAAFSELMTFQDRIKLRRGSLRLIDMSPKVRYGFGLTRLDRLFDIGDG